MSRSIELSTEVAAPPEAVFRALTDASELARWFPSSAESDPRTGGAFTYRFDFGDPEKDHVSAGEYRDVVANERVSYPWRTPQGPTEVEFRLWRSNGATVVELTHSGWGEGAEWEQSQENHRQGWSFFLQNLKAYLEGGDDGRSAAMGMQTPAAV